MYSISRGHCSSFDVNVWDFDPRYAPMQDKIASYVKAPMGAYPGHYGRKMVHFAKFSNFVVTTG